MVLVTSKTSVGRADAGALVSGRGDGEGVVMRAALLAQGARDRGSGSTRPEGTAGQPDGALVYLWRLLRRLSQAVGRVRGISWQAGATLRLRGRSAHDGSPRGRAAGVLVHRSCFSLPVADGARAQAAASVTISGTVTVVTSSEAT